MNLRLPLIAALSIPTVAAAQIALAPRPIAAIPADAVAAATASEFRGHRVEGRELDTEVDKLFNQLEWHERLPDAVRAAEQAEKPIVWLQLLGDLDGFT